MEDRHTFIFPALSCPQDTRVNYYSLPSNPYLPWSLFIMDISRWLKPSWPLVSDRCLNSRLSRAKRRLGILIQEVEDPSFGDKRGQKSIAKTRSAQPLQELPKKKAATEGTDGEGLAPGRSGSRPGPLRSPAGGAGPGPAGPRPGQTARGHFCFPAALSLQSRSSRGLLQWQPGRFEPCQAQKPPQHGRQQPGRGRQTEGLLFRASPSCGELEVSGLGEGTGGPGGSPEAGPSALALWGPFSSAPQKRGARPLPSAPRRAGSRGRSLGGGGGGGDPPCARAWPMAGELCKWAG